MAYGSLKVDQLQTSTQTVSIDALAPKASPALTGTPTAPTAAADTNTTQLATTAYVVGQAYAKLASPSLTGTPTAPTASADTSTTQIATTAYVVGQAYAKLASPTLTGTPAAPTAATDTSTTQIATTAFVTGQAAGTSPVMAGTAAVGTSVKFARADHVHPSDTSKANLASPALTGTPTAPTAVADTNTTQIATTAYVVGQAYAKLASPALTGTPTAPTAAVDTSTTQIATTAYVVGQGYAKTAAPVFTSSITLNAQAPIRFADSDGSHWVAFRAPATVAANVTWTLPAADGAANQVLRTDGAGNLSFYTLASAASIGVCIALG